MSNTEAVNPLVLMTPPEPMTIPLGLTSNTFPLELMIPLIAEGFAEMTRFNIAEFIPGWLKFTELPEPTEKLFQLMIVRSERLFTFKLFPLTWMLAVPATTLAPFGIPSLLTTPRPSCAAIKGAKSVCWQTSKTQLNNATFRNRKEWGFIGSAKKSKVCEVGRISRKRGDLQFVMLSCRYYGAIRSTALHYIYPSSYCRLAKCEFFLIGGLFKRWSFWLVKPMEFVRKRADSRQCAVHQSRWPLRGQ